MMGRLTSARSHLRRPVARLTDAFPHERRSGHAQRPSRDSLELHGIVAGEDLDLGAVARAERSQTLLVPEARAPVLLHHPLVETQPRRAARLGVQLRLPEEGVGRLEEPAVLA